MEQEFLGYRVVEAKTGKILMSFLFLETPERYDTEVKLNADTCARLLASDGDNVRVAPVYRFRDGDNIGPDYMVY